VREMVKLRKYKGFPNSRTGRAFFSNGRSRFLTAIIPSADLGALLRATGPGAPAPAMARKNHPRPPGSRSVRLKKVEIG